MQWELQSRFSATNRALPGGFNGSKDVEGADGALEEEQWNVNAWPGRTYQMLTVPKQLND